MSIIYDALKKVGESQATTTHAPEDKPKSVSAPAVKPVLFSAYIPFVVFGVVLAVLIFLVVNFFLRSRTFTKASAVAEAPLESTRTPLPEASQLGTPVAKPLSPIPPALSQESFSLSGVFFSGEEGYALINNQILKVGDSIGAATVKRIDLNEVVLEAQGSSIKLTTKH